MNNFLNKKVIVYLDKQDNSSFVGTLKEIHDNYILLEQNYKLILVYLNKVLAIQEID